MRNKTILISHRGNVDGSSPETENRPESIDAAIKNGFHVEVDVWHCNGWFLGHDEALCEVDEMFLLDRSEFLWCHAKNIEALVGMIPLGLNCFFHVDDPYTITSRGHILAKPGSALNQSCVVMMPEYADYNHDELARAKGICSDKILEYAI